MVFTGSGATSPVYRSVKAGQGWAGLNGSKTCLSLISSLLGAPSSFEPLRGGSALWDQSVLKNRKLYGAKICVTKIMVVDADKGQSPVYLFKQIPLNTLRQRVSGVGVFSSAQLAANPAQLLSFNLGFLDDNVSYDTTTGTLVVRADSLGGCCIIMRNVIAELHYGSQLTTPFKARTSKELNDACGGGFTFGQCTTVLPTNERNAYVDLCEFLGSIRVERFADTPWYSVNARASNNPLDINLVEQADRNYYRDINRYYMQIGDNTLSRTVLYPSIFGSGAKSPNAYPSAPGAKPTIEGFLNISKKRECMHALHKSCTGECASRSAAIAASHPEIKVFNVAQEPLIPYNAYSGFLKKKSP